MFNIKSISLHEWFVFGLGKFLMGVAVGLTAAGKHPKWVLATLITGIIFEIPSLIAVYRHKPE